MKSRARRLPDWLTSGPVLFTGLSFMLMYLLFPYLSDDYWYMYTSHITTAGHEGFLRGFMDNLDFRYHNDNIRLANIVFSLFLWLPKWVGDVIAGLSVWGMCVLTARAAGLPLRSFCWAAGACMAVIFGLPWIDQMAVQCFAFNYMVSSVMALTAVCVYMGRIRALWAWALALGLLLGMWHEGFAVPVGAAGVALCLLWRRRFAGPANLALTAGLIVGSLWLLLAPPTSDRMKVFQLLAPLKYSIPLMVFCMMALVAGCSRRVRRAVDPAMVVLVLAAGVTTYVIHTVTHFAARISWCGNLVSLVGILYLARIMWRELQPRRGLRIAARAIVCVAAALTAVHLVAVDVQAARIRRQTAEISARLAAGDDPVFLHYSNNLNTSPWTLQRPYSNMFEFGWDMRNMSMYHGRERTVNVIPAVLRDVTATFGTPMPTWPALRRVDNTWFISADSIEGSPRNVFATVSFGPLRYTRELVFKPFTSRADSLLYYAVHPMNSGTAFMFHDITDITRP